MKEITKFRVWVNIPGLEPIRGTQLYDTKEEACKNKNASVPYYIDIVDGTTYDIQPEITHHEGWDEKLPIGFYPGPKSALRLIDTDQRSYGHWELYQAETERGKEYYVELFLAKEQ